MRIALIAALTAGFLLAGCGSGGDGEPTTTTPTHTTTLPPLPTTTTRPPTTTPAPTTPPPTPKTMDFTADVQSGTAPLQINFTVKATGADSSTDWVMSFGEGPDATGTTFPGTASHVYQTAGNFVASANVTFGDGKSIVKTISIGVLTPAPSAPLYNHTFSFTIPVPDPASGFFCLGVGGPPDEVMCLENQIRTLNENGGNKTFFVAYDVTVPAGATQMLIEAGSHDAQTCQGSPVGTFCSPDYDLFMYDPAGAASAVGSASDFEVATIENPAAGTWTIVTAYFLGPPNGASTTHILIT